MDHEIDNQKPSGTEGGQVKNPRVGDWVWVKGQIKNTQFGATETEVEICEQRVYVRIFDCRPVEPPVIKQSLTTESNSPKTLGSSSDPINPSHYKHLPAEAIDIIEAAIAGAPSNKAAYLHGQSLKYPLRCWEKGGVEDLKKARWYLDRLIKEASE